MADRKTELMMQIFQEILACPDLREFDWQLLSLVIEVEEGVVSNQGFLYSSEGEIKPFSVRSMPFHEALHELPAAMRVEGEEPWHECLVQIRRSDGEARTEFNYEPELRWKIGPKNFREMREALRPRFDEES